MKIVYDYQIFSLQRFGGISRYFFELARIFSGYDCDVIECSINSPLFINEYLRNASFSNLRVNGMYMPSNPSLNSAYKFINRPLSRLLQKISCPDILHETYYSPNTTVSSSTPVVITVYDMIHELFLASDKIKYYKKLAVERADHVICISQNTRDDLIQLLGVDPKKISVVYLGYALTQCKKCFVPLPKRPFLLYVGSRNGHKNFKNFLSAYASHPELLNHYDVVAFGGGAFKIQEIDMIQSLKVPLTQVHQISGDDGALKELYMKADIFVYPSVYEGFGIPPLEAMSFDCPVACSNTSSMPEVVGHAAVQFDPYDVESIAYELLKLSSDTKLRKNLIERGRERILDFSWEKCALDTLNVYNKLV